MNDQPFDFPPSQEISMKEDQNNILDADTKIITLHQEEDVNPVNDISGADTYIPDTETAVSDRSKATTGKNGAGGRRRPADQGGSDMRNVPADRNRTDPRRRPKGKSGAGTREASGNASAAVRRTPPGNTNPRSRQSSSGAANTRSGTRKTAAGRNGAGKPRTAAGALRKKKPASRRLRISHIHIGIIVLAFLIGIVGAVRLAIWNKGKASDYDPDQITTEFDTEPEDFRVPPDPQAGGSKTDDGVTTILLLGNGVLAETREEEDGIGRRLESLTGGKVYDASLNHTYLSVKNAVYEESYQTDVFSLYWITQCITLGDFTLLEDNARSWDGDSGVGDMVEMLKNLDMDTVDVITIMYDYSDYKDGRLLAGPYDETMAATCCGCLLQSVRLLQQTYPHIQIIVSSPYFACVEDEDGQLQPGSIYNNGQGTLADYMIAYKNIAVISRVSFIDNYFGTITEDNYESCLEDDKQSLNTKGRNAIAERIASFISQ